MLPRPLWSLTFVSGAGGPLVGLRKPGTHHHEPHAFVEIALYGGYWVHRLFSAQL